MHIFVSLLIFNYYPALSCGGISSDFSRLGLRPRRLKSDDIPQD